jgi:O-antigen ligase
MISTILFAGWAFRVYSLQNHPIRVAMALFLMVTFIAITYSKVSNNPRLLDRYKYTAKVIDEADLAQEGKSHSLRGRYELLTLAWRIAIEHPFGIGLNNFGYYADKFAHSNYFELLACTGFPGLFIFYSIYLVLFLKAFRLPSKAFGAEEARRLMLTFPLVLAVLDVGLVNYYSKDFWLSVSLVASNLALASQKKSNQLINQY